MPYWYLQPGKLGILILFGSSISRSENYKVLLLLFLLHTPIFINAETLYWIPGLLMVGASPSTCLPCIPSGSSASHEQLL